MKASLYEYDEKKTQEILKRQYMREGEKQGFDRGEKQGREEEGLKRQLAYLRDVLYYRFGVDPEETSPLLANKSLDELDALAEVLKNCGSFEEFRERV